MPGPGESTGSFGLGDLSAGLGFIRDLDATFGGKHDGGARKWQQDMFQWQTNVAKEFAQMGVRWRVEDAKAAGIHPALALGMQPVQGSSPGVFESGSSRGRSTQESTMAIAQLEAAKAATQKDYAEASYYAALAQKARQDSRNANAVPLPSGPIPAGMKDDPQAFVRVNPVDPIRHVDWVKLEADPVTASSSTTPGVTAGIDHPAMRQFVAPNGFRMLVPAGSGGGMPEDIDPSMWPLVLGANKAKYGEKWLMDYLEYAVTGGRKEQLSPGGRKLRQWLKRLVN